MESTFFSKMYILLNCRVVEGGVTALKCSCVRFMIELIQKNKEVPYEILTNTLKWKHDESMCKHKHNRARYIVFQSGVEGAGYLTGEKK